MAKDLNRSIKIYIDNSDAMKKATDFTAKIEKLEKALEDLNNQGKKDSPEYQRKEKDLRSLQASLTRYEEKVRDTERVLRNLSGATKGELLAVQKALRNELKHTARDTEEYQAKLEALKAVKEELAEINEEERLEMGRQSSMLSNLTDGFNKYFGIVASAIAAITGISFTLRKLSQDAAEMDDVYSDVMKTTGNTKDEVLELNEAFKQMDTRTSREQLNMLARDAGKLGISAKEDILEFVEGANQINVALGEDLGEDAIREIGKITDAYAKSTKEFASLGLKDKMLSVGSAINELGATSTANEQYLVSFAGRLGGIASQAGLSVQNVMGFASALDQNMQAVEMSATAFQKLIMKMLTDVELFANIAGMSMSDFQQLLEQDVNQAILLVLRNLGDQGGLQQLIPIFKDMGLDAARAAQVISSLAGNVDKIAEAQGIANKAFAENISLTNEYNIKNNNAQAQLEKQKKAFKDAALELGERLNPALLKSTKFTTYFIKLLPSLLDFLEKYGKYLGVLVSVGLSYVAGMKLQVLWNTRLAAALSLSNIQLKAKNAWLVTTKVAAIAYNGVIALMTGNVTRAAAAWRLLNITMKTNPLGLALSLISAVAGAVFLLRKETEQVNRLQEVQNKISEKVNQDYIDQESHIRVLTRTLNNENASLQKRKEALEELKRIVPGYHADLTAEGKLINNNADAIERYLIEYKKRLKLDAMSDELKELYKEEQKLSDEYYKREAKARSVTRGDATILEHLGFSDYKKNREKERDEVKAEWDKTIRLIKKLEGDVDAAHEDLSSSLTGNTTTTTTPSITPSGETKESKEKKVVNQALENIETKHQERLADIKAKFRNGEIKTESEYNRKIFAEEQAYYLLREEALQKFIDNTSDKELKSDLQKQLSESQNKRLNQEIKYQQEIDKILLNANPEEKEKRAYEERLVAVGLFGKKKEELTTEQLQALELLEKEHQANLKKIREQGEAMAKADSETKFNEAFAPEKERLQQELNELMQISSSFGGSSFDAEMEVHKKKLQMIQAEIDARTNAGMESTKLLKDMGTEEARMTGTIQKELQKRVDQYGRYGSSIGQTLGEVISGQEDALQGFADTTLDILFDVLTEIINAELIKVMASSTSAIARATAEAMATPGSALTFGAKGFATAAILTGAIMAATTAAKAALKGMLGKKSGKSGGSSESSGSGGGSSSSGSIRVKQRRKGNYTMIGAEDGRTYRNVPFGGLAQTGIVTSPTLVAETGRELIVSPPDLAALQRHVNYPVILQALQDVRGGVVPQRADGNYKGIENGNTQLSSDNQNEIMRDLAKVLKDLANKDFTPYLGASELQAELNKYNKEQKRFSQDK